MRVSVFLAICCYVVLANVQPVYGAVTLVNNGYEGVIVYIASAVNETPALIENIKSVFTAASDQLFGATRNRAYFRNISIVIPKSWTNTTINGTIPAVNLFSGYIRIDRPTAGTGHRPFVRGNLECGKSAWYMHLTPKFLTGNLSDQYGFPEKSVVHEWGHLRWGLFDEYPSVVTTASAPYRINFSPRGGNWKPVTCSKQVTGNAYQGNCDVTQVCPLDNLTIKPSCKFCPNTAQTATASFMASQWMDTVVQFCEKDDNATPESVRHDSTAQNLQNKMCNYRSSWEVMEDHEDFSGGNNPPASLQSKEQPTFTIVQESVKLRVFVYDVSGSMGRNSKITKQADSSYVVIDNVVGTGSYLGLVKFNSGATILAGLTEITSSAVRDDLKLKVPQTANGGTEIYEGLLKAIEVIEGSSFPTAGAEIVLLSDGMSNNEYIHITPTLVTKGIIVHSIAITNAADPLMAQLAADTGGNSYTYLETDSVTFADVFTQATSSNSQSATAAIEIISTTYTLTSASPVTGTFDIDSGLGLDTTITTIQYSGSSVSLIVLAPNGTTYSSQGTSNVMSLKLEGIMPVGQYSFTLTTTASSASLEVMVSSTPTSDDVDVIQVTSYSNSSTLDFNSQDQVRLIASVVKGNDPVLNASVIAVLAATSTFTPLRLTLIDTGTGADVIYGDGIYSVYLLKSYFTVSGAYNIKISVEGHGDAYIQGDSTAGADSIPGTVEDTSTTTTDVGSFERQSIPGEITVDNFVSNPVDTTPPSQITDFSVGEIYKVLVGDVQSMIYTLTWTAVGSDMDVGQAQEYDMRFNPDINFLRYNFSQSSQVPGQLPVPETSGTTETINITFNQADCDGICYLAVKSIDENGLTGDVSNIINIDIDFSYIGAFTNVAVDDATKDSIVLVLVLSLLAVLIALVILGLVVYKFLYGKQASIIPGKVDPVEDPIFAVEQADECGKSYYNENSTDAVMPFHHSDFNSKPSFSMTRTAKDHELPSNTWFLDECPGMVGVTTEHIEESMTKSTYVPDVPNIQETPDSIGTPLEEIPTQPLDNPGISNILHGHIWDGLAIKETTRKPRFDPGVLNTLEIPTTNGGNAENAPCDTGDDNVLINDEMIAESEVLDPLFIVERSDNNGK